MKQELAPKTILLPSPVLIVGTYDAEGKPNIMNAAWGGVASSNPPSVSVSLREATYTYHNIMHSKAFTINFPSEQYAREADYAGLVSGRDTNKFADTGLTPTKSKLVNAPIVEEFPYALECKLIKHVDLGLHTMFIGEIMGIVADSKVLGEKELPHIEKVRPMLFGSFGSRAYYGIGDNLGNAFSIGKAFQNK